MSSAQGGGGSAGRLPCTQPVRTKPVEALNKGGTLVISHSHVAPTSPVWVREWRPSKSIGPCGEHPTNLLFIFDESGSVTSFSDPVRYRHALAAQVMADLARTCRCRKCSAAFVTFDLLKELGPLPLNRRSARSFASEMSQLPATSSLLSSALAWAEEKAEGRKSVVTAVLSDFELFDPDLNSLFDRLGNLPGRSVAVVLRTEPPSGLVTRGIDIVRVNAGAKGTAVADGIASVLTEIRNAY